MSKINTTSSKSDNRCWVFEELLSSVCTERENVRLIRDEDCTEVFHPLTAVCSNNVFADIPINIGHWKFAYGSVNVLHGNILRMKIF